MQAFVCLKIHTSIIHQSWLILDNIDRVEITGEMKLMLPTEKQGLSIFCDSLNFFFPIFSIV